MWGNKMSDFPFRPYGANTIQYQLDPVIAQRIKELRLGLKGCNVHSWRALALRVTGFEDQMTGSDLESLACWSLPDEACWCERCDLYKECKP